MENFADQELLARIRKSDRLAFFLFLKKHWKRLYVQALQHTGDQERAFEQVSGLFASFWDQRRQLPDIEKNTAAYFMQRQDMPGCAPNTTGEEPARSSNGFPADVEKPLARLEWLFALETNPGK